MTRALREYLALSKAIPKYEYESNSDRKPTAESVAARSSWDAEMASRKGALEAYGEPARYHEARKVWHCRTETQKGEAIVDMSPSGRYSITRTRHTTGPHTWDYAKSVIRAGEEVVCTLYHNYSRMPHAWLEGREEGDFLISGEHYQGQTLVDLSTGLKASHVGSFCWAAIKPSPCGRFLAVDGCYWGAPYETVIFDVRRIRALPYPELGRFDSALGDWSSDGRLSLKWDGEIVDLPGHPLHGRKADSLTIEQDDEIEAEAARRGVDEYLRDHSEILDWVAPSV